MSSALRPTLSALVTKDLLYHIDTDVKVAVAACISEITRITAPDAPYDDELMKVCRKVGQVIENYQFFLFFFQFICKSNRHLVHASINI
ncbi:hypothetical protein AXF42_Ash007503 [Apostasia shenzhenica]|uniref:Uncharacterized protein n=1 Tax=Apostasia shenzhenica TaxID=1088818 RepID=A0A2I0A5L7_9ASPA|nr:hypothetical protein AXF42_Ash007503 [Apostasia shenzhenica]